MTPLLCMTSAMVTFAVPPFSSMTMRSLPHIGDGAEEILARSEHDAIAPKWMKTRAQAVLNAWKKRGANGIRVLNRGGQQVYRWRED